MVKGCVDIVDVVKLCGRELLRVVDVVCGGPVDMTVVGDRMEGGVCHP